MLGNSLAEADCRLSIVVTLARCRDAVRYRSPVRAGNGKKPSPGCMR
jgi:hypothetical protein